MKISYNWLKKYVDLPASLTMEKLAYDLTMRTVEVEGIHETAEQYHNIVVGKILSCEKHPNADALKVLQVDVGAEAPVQIVCGGSNVKEDQFVIVALPGSKVIWHGEGEAVEIKANKLRGVESFGMVCASTEVGLESIFPLKNDHEIVDLSGIDALPGQNIADALHIKDAIIEIDNKSMTNRPDLWGHIGIARELAAIYGLPLKEPKPFVESGKTEDIPVRIENKEACRRYVGAMFAGVKTEISPLWLRVLLSSLGIRPINSLVDITNYVMLATGQPTHGFDRRLLKGGICVRNAKENENIRLLDESELQLSQQDLLICDEEGPVALAGIMGGDRASIVEDTGDMVLEIANFEPIGVRKSAARHQIRTESATRNEKGIDRERIDLALAVAFDMIKSFYPEAKLVAFRDENTPQEDRKEIEVSMQWLKTRLGRELTEQELKMTLLPLGFQLRMEGDKVSVLPPSYRATGDVSLPDDVLEEVARMIGYENFAFVPPKVLLSGAVKLNANDVDRRVREYLAFRCGMQEIFTYPWVEEKYIKAAGISLDDCLEIAAAPSPETSHIRNSLVPDMLASVASNLRYFDVFRIFESTQVFSKGEYYPSDSDECLPLQKRHICFAIVGTEPVNLFRAAKGVLEMLPRYAMLKSYDFVQKEKPQWADKKAWLNIVQGDTTIGSFGILSMKASSDAGIKLKKVAIAEINMDAVEMLPSRTNHFEQLPSFPLVEQDFSMIIDENVAWATVEETIRKVVRKICFLEEYKGWQIPKGKKSVSFRVWFGDDNKTLSASDIEEKMNSVINKLNKRLGAEIRA